MESAPGSKQQMVAAAAAAALEKSGQRSTRLTSQGLIDLRARVAKSVVRVERTGKLPTPGIIIAATPSYCYVLVRRICVADCEIVFTDGARFPINNKDFITGPWLALAKINHGSMTPVLFTEVPVSFLDNVYLYVLQGRGMTPGSAVNPTGESMPSHLKGHFIIDSAPDWSAHFGAPVFDDTGKFLGMVARNPWTPCVMCVAMIKDEIRRNSTDLVRGELMSLNVL